jgi:hypothetical protein
MCLNFNLKCPEHSLVKNNESSFEVCVCTAHKFLAMHHKCSPGTVRQTQLATCKLEKIISAQVSLSKKRVVAQNKSNLLLKIFLQIT